MLDDTLAPVVALERAIHCKANACQARYRREAGLNVAVKIRELFSGVASAFDIHVEDVAAAGFYAEVLVLEIVE